MSNFVSLRLFYGCCCTEYSPTLCLIPFARIKFRKKIILMRVRGVGINGWIIFRKRRTSSLRWAVSHSNVLVITQHIMPTKGCLPAAAHMPSTGGTKIWLVVNTVSIGIEICKNVLCVQRYFCEHFLFLASTYVEVNMVVYFSFLFILQQYFTASEIPVCLIISDLPHVHILYLLLFLS